MSSDFQVVDKEAYDAFIEGYPGELDGSVIHFAEPNVLALHDFQRARGWDAMVALKTLDDDPTYKIRDCLLEEGGKEEEDKCDCCGEPATQDVLCRKCWGMGDDL